MRLLTLISHVINGKELKILLVHIYFICQYLLIPVSYLLLSWASESLKHSVFIIVFTCFHLQNPPVWYSDFYEILPRSMTEILFKFLAILNPWVPVGFVTTCRDIVICVEYELSPQYAPPLNLYRGYRMQLQSPAFSWYWSTDWQEIFYSSLPWSGDDKKISRSEKRWICPSDDTFPFQLTACLCLPSIWETPFPPHSPPKATFPHG